MIWVSVERGFLHSRSDLLCMSGDGLAIRLAIRPAIRLAINLALRRRRV